MDAKLDKILETVTEIRIDQVGIKKDVSQNTDDLHIHIKRTNILEGKLQKIIYLLILGAGIGLAEYGPVVLKFLKVIL